MKYCRQHALHGMVNLGSRRCAQEGCSKVSSFGVAGTTAINYFGQHAVDGMVDVRSRESAHGSSYEPALHILDDARIDRAGKAMSTECVLQFSIRPNRCAYHLEDESSVNVCPSAAKRKSLVSLPLEVRSRAE